MQKKAMAILLIVMVALPTLALAQTQIETDSSAGITDHFTHLNVPQFNGDYPLNSITITASSWIVGDLHYENLGSWMGGVQMTDNWCIYEVVLGGVLDGDNDDIIGGDVLVEEYYVVGDIMESKVFVEAFDGVIDYAGLSGFVHNYDDYQVNTVVITPDNPLFAAFIGDGEVQFSAQARVYQGVSISGADYDWGLSTQAGYDLTVIYDYIGAVATETVAFGGIKALYR